MCFSISEPHPPLAKLFDSCFLEYVPANTIPALLDRFEIVFILLIILVGCTIQNIPKPNRDILNKGNVRIKLTRTMDYEGEAVVFTVYDNGKLVGKLGSGGVFGEFEWCFDVVLMRFGLCFG